ncbi:hypothetical protein LCGC14_0468620 [marine sediment metagenome]|uniref:Uncharacterized protein n=1 Tax=marine sediment metagenome TaxID=412755 RepID=A0A0F9UZQ2_9ZZZZ
MWSKFKALPWIATAGMVAVAIVLALQSGKVIRLQKRAKKKDKHAVSLKNTEVSTYIHKGKKLAESAQLDKDEAVKVHERMEANLALMGKNSETIDDIANRFNSKRVRK